MYLVKKKGSLELPMAMKKGSHVVPLDKRSRHHISFKPVFSYNAKKTILCQHETFVENRKKPGRKKINHFW